MADTRGVKRTVSFWQLVKAPDMTPLGDIDWPGFMTEVGRRARTSGYRHTVEGADITGTVYIREFVDHLVLTKNRDDMPRQQSRSTGAVEDMITNDEGWTVVESSFVKFLDFGNVFGMLQSQITAPSPQAIAKWINATGILGSTRLTVEAVIDPQRWHHLHDAGGVTMLEFAGPSMVLNRPVTGPLNLLIGPARFGGVKVSVKVTASKNRTLEDSRERRELFEAAEALAEQIGVQNLDTAKARVFDEDNRGIRVETINLLRQRFTIKRNIQLTSGLSASVSESSAFSAILEALEKFEVDLRAAVRQDPME
ncbi:MAG: hypothetical protein ACRDTH_24155 [Pseudonocardiaceae bacterium]